MNTKDNLKVMLCCIGRLENRYIREFVEFYKSIGVTNICLCDNNRDGEDDFHDVIGDYINNGFVILKDYRNITEPIQLEAYNECYSEYKDLYDWFLFFDVDEFLFLRKDRDIKDYLSRKIFKDFEMIHVNWLLFGDCENVYYEDRPVLERFNRPIPLDSKTSYDFPDNFHTKSIVRGGLKTMIFRDTPHTPYVDGDCCNSSGRFCNKNSPFCPFDYTFVALGHFATKSAEEYSWKIKRGFCDGNLSNEDNLIDVFFKRNNFTQEKLDVLKNI